MFVGHGLLALAIVGYGARVRGWSRDRALLLGALAFGLATLPDVDMLYAVTGVWHVTSLDPLALARGFWGASTAVHRSVTHSVVVALPVAVGVGLIADDGRRRWIGYGVLATIVVVLGGAGAGAASLVVLTAFLLGAAVAGRVAAGVDIGPLPAGLAAGVGLVSHPFGDLFTGSPPALFYPLDVQAIAHRVSLAPDPTLQVLGAFFLELGAIWVGLLVLARLRGTPIRVHLRARAAIGSAYAVPALVIPAPTFDLSYPFVFSVLAMGVLGVVPGRRHVLESTGERVGIGSGPFERFVPTRRFSGSEFGSRPATTAGGSTLPDLWTALVTGMGAITTAGVVYALVYLIEYGPL